MKYKLLKDLPDIKKGAIFNWVEKHQLYICEQGIYDLNKKTVERNPKWFELIGE